MKWWLSFLDSCYPLKAWRWTTRRFRLSEWKAPQNVKELQKFLRLVNFHSRFICNFAQVVNLTMLPGRTSGSTGLGRPSKCSNTWNIGAEVKVYVHSSRPCLAICGRNGIILHHYRCHALPMNGRTQNRTYAPAVSFPESLSQQNRIMRSWIMNSWPSVWPLRNGGIT